jgi:hypothetical protein
MSQRPEVQRASGFTCLMPSPYASAGLADGRDYQSLVLLPPTNRERSAVGIGGVTRVQGLTPASPDVSEASRV